MPRDWRNRRGGLVLAAVVVAVVWIPKPQPLNLIVDAILIPFGLWLCWPGIRKVTTPDKHDPFRPFG